MSKLIVNMHLASGEGEGFVLAPSRSRCARTTETCGFKVASSTSTVRTAAPSVDKAGQASNGDEETPGISSERNAGKWSREGRTNIIMPRGMDGRQPQR